MKESRNVNQAYGNALINAADISRHYTMADGTVQALSNVSLTVNVGEFIAITGPSGSGIPGEIHADEYSRSARHLRQRNIYVFRT